MLRLSGGHRGDVLHPARRDLLRGALQRTGKITWLYKEQVKLRGHCHTNKW